MVTTTNTGILTLSSRVIPGRNRQHGLHCRLNRNVGKTQTAQPTVQNRSVGSSILFGTTGWNMVVDLGKRLVFPAKVLTTTNDLLRPNIVLWSEKERSSLLSRCQYHMRNDVRRPAKGRRQSTQSFWIFAKKITGVLGCPLLKSYGDCTDRRRAIQRLSHVAELASS